MTPLMHSSVLAGSTRSAPATQSLLTPSLPVANGITITTPGKFSLPESPLTSGIANGVDPQHQSHNGSDKGFDKEISQHPASGHSTKPLITGDPALLLALLLPETMPLETNLSASIQNAQNVQNTEASVQPNVPLLPLPAGLLNQPVCSARQPDGLALLSVRLPTEFNLSSENLPVSSLLPLTENSSENNGVIIQSGVEATKPLSTTSLSQPLPPGAEIVQGMAFTSTNTLLVNDPKIPASPPLSLPADQQAAAETLSKALGDRLQMQLDRGIQRATIRLDPPSLGKLDISLHYQEGKLQVHIQAAQPDVLRTLQQTAPELRFALSTNNQVQVNVQLSQQGSERQAHPSYHSPVTEDVSEQPDSEAEEKTIRFRDNSMITRV